MTERSHGSGLAELWVTGLGQTPASAQADAQADRPFAIQNATPGVEALRAGARDGILIAAPGPPQIVLVIETGASARRRGIRPYAALRGVAVTSQPNPPLTDPLDHLPARAIRRALADGRLKASDIGYVFVDALVGAHQAERTKHAVERGLGRWATGVTVETIGPGAAMCVIAVALAHPAGVERMATAQRSVVALAARVREMLRPGAPDAAVLLTMGVGDTNAAIAFSAPQ